MHCTNYFCRRALLLFLISGLFLNLSTAKAQYFGQNKVRYRAFNFKVLKTAHFDVYYYPVEEKMAFESAHLAERWYTRHSTMLDYDLTGRQPLIIYASAAEFDETNAISGQLGEGVGGVTEALKRRIIVPLSGPLAETNHVIGHELVHAFQYDITGENNGHAVLGAPTALRLPLWFIEGMAEYLSLGSTDPLTAMWMRDAAKSKKKLPTVKQLDDPDYFPYRYGQALLAYIAGIWGDDSIAELLKAAGKTGNINGAIKEVLGISPDSLSKNWHAAIHKDYGPLVDITKSPDYYGPALVSEKKGGGEYNVGPVISPDGENMIFFSEKSLFAIDLYLADAHTGEIKRKLTKLEVDPHFSSLGFIYSAGTWSPTGDRVAFAATYKDRPALTILDIKSDKETRELHFRHFGEILNPAWSPDGRYIAFSALEGGVSDIFIYDLQSDSLERITDDSYADIHPAWSPDGKQLAFVTDRFTTDLEILKPGSYQLAVYKPETNELSEIKTFDTGNQINPQWSGDGASLYFVSDYSGIANIYRYDIAAGDIFRITNLYTGVSGITSSSPALSVAWQTNKLVYCAYENSKYDIYAIESPDKLAGEPHAAYSVSSYESLGIAGPAKLPPQNPEPDALTMELNDYATGLPSGEDFADNKYHPHLTLDNIGQPYLAAGFDAFGSYLGGGAALFWSDMLGDNNLATMLQIQTGGGFTDIAALVGYQNMHRRLNWGGSISQIPYTLTSFASGYGMVDSTYTYIERQYTWRQTNRDISANMAYPLSRVMRLEFSGAYDYISFDQRIETTAYDAATGNLIYDHTDKLPSLNSLGLVTPSAAIVYDNSFFGATSPILGQRYRVETAQSFGSITMTTVLADYRRYLMPIQPFTLAFRILHYGRYGSDAEDNRLTPLFIGYQDLVRGYDSGTFNASECDSTGDCPGFDRLFGSKIAVANFELRFPLFHALGIGRGYYGVFPIETGAFYDVGLAWTNQDKASFLNGDRKPVKSYGALARANVLGYIILELDYVKPIDRPNKGWLWQFNFSSGF